MTRKDLTVFIPLALLPIFFLSGTLTSSHTFFMRDLTYQFHPWRSLAAQFMQSGEMPLWNSYAMGGMPFLANGQSSILYPGTLPFFFWDFASALKMFHWIHYAIAAAGFYVLSIKLGFPRVASFAAAVLYAFNGYVLTRLEFLSLLGSLVWLPALLLFATQIKFHPTLAALGLALGMLFSFYAGHPQTFLMQTAFVGVFCLVRNPTAASVRCLAGGIFIFLLLSAPQWLPMTELLSRSVRSGEGIGLMESGTYSLPYSGLSGLLSPLLMTEHKDQFTGERYFWIWSAWWGLAASGLMLASLARAKTRLFMLSAFFLATGILLSLGNHLPFFGFLHQHFLPLRLFRYPPAALYWAVIGACFLVLQGFRTLGRNGLMIAACILIVAELLSYSRKMHPTIDSKHYQTTFQNVRTVQNSNPGTVLLSPKVNFTRRLPGKSAAHAAMKTRALFFDLTNLPYRIRSLNPASEPLALLSHKKLWAHLKGLPLSELHFNLSRLNVTHLLTEDALKPPWNLIGEDENIRVYKNSQAAGDVFALDKSRSIPPKLLRVENDHAEAVFNLPEQDRLITHIPDYPGWRIYCREHGRHDADGGAPIPLNLHISAVLTPGSHHLYLVYHSRFFALSLMLFAAGLALIFLRSSRSFLIQ